MSLRLDYGKIVFATDIDRQTSNHTKVIRLSSLAIRTLPRLLALMDLGNRIGTLLVLMF